MRLRHLVSHSMPGLPEPFGISFGDSPFQILVGPNGSGKSSICRALRDTLWPARSARHGFRVESRWRDAQGRSWQGRLDGEVVWERDGVPARPLLPPEDAAAGYFFSLSALWKADEPDRRFAADCLKRMAGGYDLPAWRRGVVFPTRNACSRAARALEAARGDLRRLRLRHRELAGKISAREGIESEIAAAGRALSRRRLVEQALEFRRKRELLEPLERRLAAFPGGMEHVSETTVKEYDTLSESLEAKLGELSRRRCAREQALQGAASPGLPETPLPEAAFHALSLCLERARRRDDEAAAAEREGLRLDARLQERIEGMEVPVDPVRIDLSAAALAALDRALDDFERAREEADRAARECAQARTRAAESRPERLGALKAARRQLDGALTGEEAPRSPGPRPKSGRAEAWSRAAFPGLVGIGLLGAGLVAGEAPLFIAAVGALLLAVSLFQGLAGSRRRHGRGAGSPVNSVSARIAELPGVEPPGDLSPGGISAALSEWDLEIERLSEALRAERSLETLNSAAETSRAARESARARLAAAFERVAGGAPAPETLSGPSIRRSLERLREWDDLRRKREDAGMQAESARGQSEAALREVRERLAKLGVSFRAAGIEDGTAGVRKLQEAWSGRDRLREEARRLAERIDELRADARELEARRETLLRRVSVDPAAKNSRAQLLEKQRRLPEYVELRKERDGLQLRIEELDRVLAEAPELAGLDVASLERREADLQERARQRDEWIKASQEIEVEVRLASEGNEFERHEIREREARDRGRRLAAEAVEAAVGAFLTEKVLDTYVGESRPPVLERAERLFSRFTRGRYCLRMDPSEQQGAGELRAYDVFLGRGQRLDELSDATRLQLLVASRLAYAFEREGDLHPPLFLDETLSTSDPGRMEAVLEAMIDLSSERQVFYLCSDPADAAAILEACRRKHAPIPEVTDLAAVRGLAAAAPPEVLRGADLSSAEPPPPPNPGESPETYGRRLRVPGSSIFQPWTALDLFYLLGDRLDLVWRLRRLGLVRVGQLPGFFKHDVPETVFSREETTLLNRRMAVVRAVHAALSVGRGRPVDREDLAATGAVSERFLAPLSAMARELRGDARALIERIEGPRDPRAKGFRQEKRRQLEQVLQEERFIDARPELSREEVLAKVLSDPEVAGFYAERYPADSGRLGEVRGLLQRLGLLWRDGERLFES